MPLSRKKSCVRCRQARARCDQGFPSCSRCYGKAQRCEYEGDGPRVAPYTWLPVAMNTGAGELLPTSQDEASSLTASTSVLTVPAEPDWFEVEAPDFLDCLKMDSVGPLLTLPPGEDTSPPDPPFFGTLSASSRDSISTSAIINAEPRQVQAVTPTSRGILRRRVWLEHNVLSSILVGQLTSYPKMMIEGDTLPPFICPPCFTHEHLAPECGEQGHHRCLPEDLAVCAGLVRMYYDRTASSSAFVWKSIYDECHKLHDNYYHYDSYRQLQVLQAMLVYTLLQAGDPGTIERNGAQQLLGMLLRIIFQLSHTMVWAGELSRHRPERSDWIYIESLGRAITVIGTLDLLLDGIRPPDDEKKPSCAPGGVCAFPLPCHRDLWLARSNRAWRAAYDRQMAGNRTMKILTALDLLKYDRVGLAGDALPDHEFADEFADLARWAEGLDALGTLIYMVLPLQRWRQQELTVASPVY